MNKQPVLYMQTDPRWADKDYSARGESTTIGKSGCGPTCAAMLIETITGEKFTPVDACAWARKKGYKAPHQGTYYSYFVPQFNAHGIDCKRINGVSVYGSKTAAAHRDAFELLKEGWYLIACMGKGLWTSSGHFVVVWWEDGWVRINDPASKATQRVKGNWDTFRSQVKYYWAIDARKHNKEAVQPMKEGPSGDREQAVQSTKEGPSGDREQAVQSTKEGPSGNREQEDTMNYYKTMADIPKDYKAAVKKAVDAGALKGTGTGLDVSEDLCRVLTILDRLGKLD